MFEIISKDRGEALNIFDMILEGNQYLLYNNAEHIATSLLN